MGGARRGGLPPFPWFLNPGASHVTSWLTLKHGLTTQGDGDGTLEAELRIVRTAIPNTGRKGMVLPILRSLGVVPTLYPP